MIIYFCICSIFSLLNILESRLGPIGSLGKMKWSNKNIPFRANGMLWQDLRNRKVRQRVQSSALNSWNIPSRIN